ncbi:MAG: hypothetical protein ACYSYU_09705, partial [Planctomycetota bacterium]
MRRLLTIGKTKSMMPLLLLSAMVVSALSIEANAGYKVQSGRVQVSGTSMGVTITPVSDMSRAFVLISSGTGYTNSDTNADEVQVRGYLSNTSNIQFERISSLNSTWVSYQVIECTGNEFTVYRGSNSFTPAETSKTINVGGTVNAANCLAYVTVDNDTSSVSYYNQAMLTARVSSATQVTIERADSGNAAPNFNWVVVEFDTNKISSIQHGSVTASNNTYSSPKTVDINSVDPNSSILIFQTRSSLNGLVYTAWAGNFNSSTQIKFYQNEAASSVDIEWYVIDFGVGSAQRGLLNESTNNNWLTSDATLSPAVNTTRTINFHSMTCKSNKTYYPAAMSTAEFTSDTNLRIQRLRNGRSGYIEWQTLDLTTYTVTASAGANGYVDPNGPVSVDYDGSQLFTASPDTGYEVDTWSVDGNSVQTGGSTYTITNVTSNHTLNVT